MIKITQLGLLEGLIFFFEEIKRLFKMTPKIYDNVKM